MRYYKIINDDYILGVGTGATGGITITLEEYEALLAHFGTKPSIEEGYDYHLKTNLTWERFEVITPIIEEMATEEDYLEALRELGVKVDDEE